MFDAPDCGRERLRWLLRRARGFRDAAPSRGRPRRLCGLYRAIKRGGRLTLANAANHSVLSDQSAAPVEHMQKGRVDGSSATNRIRTDEVSVGRCARICTCRPEREDPEAEARRLIE